MQLNRLVPGTWVPLILLTIVTAGGLRGRAVVYERADTREASGYHRAKSGPNLKWCSEANLQMLKESLLTSSGSFKAERGGFEPPVQVYPVQQFSKLSP